MGETCTERRTPGIVDSAGPLQLLRTQCVLAPMTDPKDRPLVEIVARQICKAIGSSTVDDRIVLQSRLAPPSKSVAVSRRQRYTLRKLKEVDFDRALALALARGWLIEEEGRLSLSEAGVELATRSRVGIRRRRLSP